MSSVSLPEIREAEAPPAIAAIYAALNEGIGIGQVNLIWRHTAPCHYAGSYIKKLSLWPCMTGRRSAEGDEL
jgi:hypothetical protein